MAEEEPFECAAGMEPTKVQLSGPNVISTLDAPPRADAVRLQEAAIRKHLQDRRAPGQEPDGS
jgi:hypothetical protein